LVGSFWQSTDPYGSAAAGWAVRGTDAATSSETRAAMRVTRALQRLGLWRVEIESGFGEESGDEVWPVLDPFQSGLDQGEELVDAAFGQVGQGPLQMRPHRLSRLVTVWG